jgi:hypothetical protein
MEKVLSVEIYLILNYVDDLLLHMDLQEANCLQPYPNLKRSLMPGTNIFFEVDQMSTLLPSMQQKEFHTTTTTLLYLEKRGRPNQLTKTSFLCTRVKAPMQGDQSKLFVSIGISLMSLRKNAHLTQATIHSISIYRCRFCISCRFEVPWWSSYLCQQFFSLYFIEETKLHDQKSYRK